MPMMMAPSSSRKLAHVDGEMATAKAVSEVGTIMGISNYATSSLEEIANAGNGGVQWCQLYMGKEEEYNKRVLDDAMKHGVKAIILTADSTAGGNREADKANHFSFPLPMPIAEQAEKVVGKGEDVGPLLGQTLQWVRPESVRWIMEYTKLPVIVKGVQAPEDAVIAMDAGASAIYVSNHGGRQLDGGPGSFDMLGLIADAVKKKVPIIFDSGIRCGQHRVAPKGR